MRGRTFGRRTCLDTYRRRGRSSPRPPQPGNVIRWKLWTPKIASAAGKTYWDARDNNFYRWPAALPRGLPDGGVVIEGQRLNLIADNRPAALRQMFGAAQGGTGTAGSVIGLPSPVVTTQIQPNLAMQVTTGADWHTGPFTPHFHSKPPAPDPAAGHYSAAYMMRHADNDGTLSPAHLNATIEFDLGAGEPAHQHRIPATWARYSLDAPTGATPAPFFHGIDPAALQFYGITVERAPFPGQLIETDGTEASQVHEGDDVRLPSFLVPRWFTHNVWHMEICPEASATDLARYGSPFTILSLSHDDYISLNPQGQIEIYAAGVAVLTTDPLDWSRDQSFELEVDAAAGTVAIHDRSLHGQSRDLAFFLGGAGRALPEDVARFHTPTGSGWAWSAARGIQVGARTTASARGTSTGLYDFFFGRVGPCFKGTYTPPIDPAGSRTGLPAGLPKTV